MTTHRPDSESDLPPELIAVIAGDEWAALTHETDDGRAIMICKAPGSRVSPNGHGPLPISTAIESLPPALGARGPVLAGLYQDPQRDTPDLYSALKSGPT